ncbi:MAG: DUF2281 domain-containing protein [candidate division WOR-3 bacterium]|nr:MAG: DUF2281 domain-containing protein [candidate division WOR-3 bacterium]
MTKREALLKEVDGVPEAYLGEVLDFVLFLKKRIARDAYACAAVSESVLAKDWLRPEEDEAWKDL